MEIDFATGNTVRDVELDVRRRKIAAEQRGYRLKDIKFSMDCDAENDMDFFVATMLFDDADEPRKKFIADRCAELELLYQMRGTLTEQYPNDDKSVATVDELIAKATNALLAATADAQNEKRADDPTR